MGGGQNWGGGAPVGMLAQEEGGFAPIRLHPRPHSLRPRFGLRLVLHSHFCGRRSEEHIRETPASLQAVLDTVQAS